MSNGQIGGADEKIDCLFVQYGLAHEVVSLSSEDCFQGGYNKLQLACLNERGPRLYVNITKAVQLNGC